MKATGIIVEYNPFHNGHVHHLQAAKQKTQADIVIAVMSGNFLQRGEPAIIDKFHRAKAAIQTGVDIVIELPYPYAVQSSELFAKGAVYSLYELGVTSICFGSEEGKINPFIQAASMLEQSKALYELELHKHLDEGDGFPVASSKAYDAIGLDVLKMNEPNNILGLSYTKTILENNLQIEPLTIQRVHNAYHDTSINHSISSATSIRKELLMYGLSQTVTNTLPSATIKQLKQYKTKSTVWHHWEHYFPFLHYKITSMKPSELKNFLGVDEGLEHRIKETASYTKSYSNWLEKIKTKRYTTNRLQRMFTHILTHTTKEENNRIQQLNSIPYLRLLGMNKSGRHYINQQKKHLSIPLITNLKRDMPHDYLLDERATNIYYSFLHPEQRTALRKQEFSGPYFG